MDVWAEFHKQFDTDDGSLPEVHLHDLGSAGILTACHLLTERGGMPRPNYSVWDIREQRDRTDLAWTEAVRGVVDRRFECFQSLFSGIRVSDTTLPELGVYVSDDEIALNYRMGSEWNTATVAAFLELLELLLSVAPSSRMVPDRTIPDPDAFMKSWTAFALERSSIKSRTA